MRIIGLPSNHTNKPPTLFPPFINLQKQYSEAASSVTNFSVRFSYIGPWPWQVPVVHQSSILKRVKINCFPCWQNSPPQNKHRWYQSSCLSSTKYVWKLNRRIRYEAKVIYLQSLQHLDMILQWKQPSNQLMRLQHLDLWILALYPYEIVWNDKLGAVV